jgi:hypothetical protein
MTRLHEMTNEELVTAIAGLRDELEWPATPNVVPAVRASITNDGTPPPLFAPRLSLPSRRRTLIVIVAALIAIASIAIAARLVFRVGAISVRVVPGAPETLPTDVAVPAHLGREVSMDRAEAIAGFDAARPAALGPPDRVWVDEAVIDPVSGEVARRIVTAWRPSAVLPPIPRTNIGALMMQFEGEWEVAAKHLFAETNRFGVAIVDGRRAFWTTGPHVLALVVGDHIERVRVTGNVIIWQDAGFTFRLETARPKAAMIVLAEALT